VPLQEIEECGYGRLLDRSRAGLGLMSSKGCAEVDDAKKFGVELLFPGAIVAIVVWGRAPRNG
jgi:hypothetical protein